MPPPSSRPAAFSATTRATASPVSDSFTCSIDTPYSSSVRSPAQSMKAFVRGSPPQAFQ
jgi:hypothetical protein